MTMPSAAISSLRLSQRRSCSAMRSWARARMRASCSDAVSPSWLISTMPARIWPARPATRTMKNSSRLLPEMDRKRSRSSRGWLAIARLFQHAQIEAQPGDLAVDEAAGIAEAGRRRCPGACGRGCRARHLALKVLIVLVVASHHLTHGTSMAYYADMKEA